MKVLFICVENTCRSQMAEGIARSMGLQTASGGIAAGASVNPDAVAVMSEIGIHISGQYTKSMDMLDLSEFDAVISMCSVKTADVCPSRFVGTQANWNIDDPKGQGLEFFRRVRDEIRLKVAALAKASLCDAADTRSDG